MKIAIGFDGSIVILDNEQKRHLFDSCEAAKIRTAIYKWVQKKNEGIIY